MRPLKKLLKQVVRTSTGYDLSLLRVQVGDDYKDQRRLLEQKGPVQTIFDVGANVGQTTYKYRKLFPRADIYAFEPFPEVCAKYVQTFAEDRRVHPINRALSAKNGNAELFLHANHYTNSLLQNGPASKNDMANYQPTGTVSVATQTLDDFCRERSISHIDILKLDVQGGELLVLQGATELFERNAIRLIYVEVEFVPIYAKQPLFEDIQSFLAERGFRCHQLYNKAEAADGSPVAADAIFVRESVV